MPPCWYKIYGSLNGPSHDNSIELPCVNDPEAIMILSSYPGISSGIGTTLESIADDAWMASAYLISLSGFLKIIVWTISALISLYFGLTSNPNFSNT